MEWTHEDNTRYAGMTAATLDRLPWLDAGNGMDETVEEDFFSETQPSGHPPVRLSENKQFLHCEVRMPGARVEDIEITLIGTDLYVRTTRNQIEMPSEANIRSDLVPTRYQRCIPLGHAVDPDQIHPIFIDGILHITASKRSVPDSVNVAVVAASDN